MAKDSVGLMFGSFNPPHSGHVETAATAREAGSLSEVWMLPIPVSATKKGTAQAAFSDKVTMCEIISKPHDWLRVSPAATNFQSTPVGQLQSIKRLVQSLVQSFPETEFHIVGGNDFNVRMKLAIATLSVVNKITHPEMGFSKYATPTAMAIVDRIGCAYRTLEHVMDLPAIERSMVDGETVSSSMIRDSLQSGEHDIHGLPEDLTEFIIENNIYTPG